MDVLECHVQTLNVEYFVLYLSFIIYIDGNLGYMNTFINYISKSIKFPY